MYQALKYKEETGELNDLKIPSEGTVRKVMKQIQLIHEPKRKPNGITKADREARKSDDLLKRDFSADAPLKKCVTDITEIKAKDGRLYVSAIFDCYDLMPNGLAMADHMRAELCCETLKNARLRFPEIRGAILHSDRGSQYTSAAYRAAIQTYGIVQSMNSAGGRCHDNARCESIWARMKEELFYHRGRMCQVILTISHLRFDDLRLQPKVFQRVRNGCSVRFHLGKMRLLLGGEILHIGRIVDALGFR